MVHYIKEHDADLLTSQEDRDNGYTLTQTTLDPITIYSANNTWKTIIKNGLQVAVRVVNIDPTTNVRPYAYNIDRYNWDEGLIYAELNLVIEVLKEEGQDTNNYDATIIGYAGNNKWRWRCTDGTVLFTDSPKVLTSSTIYRETAPGVYEADPDVAVSQIKSVWNYL